MTTTDTTVELTKAQSSALALLTEGPARPASATDLDRRTIYRGVSKELVQLGYAANDPTSKTAQVVITHHGRAALAISRGEPAPNPDDALDLPDTSSSYEEIVAAHDPTSALAPPAQYVEHIPVEILHEVGHNRDKGDLEGLTASIRARGVRHPVIVRPIAGGGGYEIVDGARRVAASAMAAKTTVPCVIEPDLGDADAELDRILLNLVRLDPTPLEEAAAYERLTKTPFKMTADQVADAVGRSASHVSKRRSLLVLPAPARDALLDGRMNIQTALGMTALAKDKERLDTAVKAIPPTKASGQTLEWARQQLERTINSQIGELNRVRKLETLTKELEAAGETVVAWAEFVDAEDEHGELRWREVDEGEEHEAVVIQPHSSLRVLKITTQPEPTAAAGTSTGGAHKPPRPEGDIGFVEQARRKKQQELNEIAVPRRAIVHNLLREPGQDDVLQAYIVDEVTAAILEDSEIGYFDRAIALELLGLGEDVARDYTIDRQNFAEYAQRTTLTRLRATAAALMSIGEATLVSPSEKREPGCWAPVDDDSYDDHTIERRYLAFLERHGYELHPTEIAAITPAPEDNPASGTDTGSGS